MTSSKLDEAIAAILSSVEHAEFLRDAEALQATRASSIRRHRDEENKAIGKIALRHIRRYLSPAVFNVTVSGYCWTETTYHVGRDPTYTIKPEVEITIQDGKPGTSRSHLRFNFPVANETKLKADLADLAEWLKKMPWGI